MKKAPTEAVLKDIRRATRHQFSAEEKIRIVLEGLHGEESIAKLCRREGISSSMYYGWSKEFLEAGKRRLAGTSRAGHPHQLLNFRGWAGCGVACAGCATSDGDCHAIFRWRSMF